MKINNLFKIILVLLVIGLIGFVTINGLEFGNYRIKSVDESINLGLDLRGGIYVLLEAEEEQGQKVSGEEILGAIEVIRGRIDELGVTEPVITRQGDKRIRIELPGVEDTDAALNLIGQTASLRFIAPDGELILTGSEVSDASAIFGPNNEPLVSLTLNTEGRSKFAEATEKYLNQHISIFLDDRMITSPYVRNIITRGEAVIEGQRNIEEAAELAMLIRAGALPVDLTTQEIRSIGPTLGEDSLEKSLNAAIIGLIIVLMFMIIYYRIPGLIANFALFLYIFLVLIIFVSIGATLTLPGIAGFILSIGMAVDANIIIFERIKEEIKNGKTLRASIDAGFTRAFRTIMDANITTLIVAAILFYFGSGPIRGFAVTLSIGIIISMFSAIVITRLLLRNFVASRILNNIKLYGG